MLWVARRDTTVLKEKCFGFATRDTIVLREKCFGFATRDNSA
jgi:hypothetical protein